MSARDHAHGMDMISWPCGIAVWHQVAEGRETLFQNTELNGPAQERER